MTKGGRVLTEYSVLQGQPGPYRYLYLFPQSSGIVSGTARPRCSGAAEPEADFPGPAIAAPNLRQSKLERQIYGCNTNTIQPRAVLLVEKHHTNCAMALVAMRQQPAHLDDLSAQPRSGACATRDGLLPAWGRGHDIGRREELKRCGGQPQDGPSVIWRTIRTVRRSATPLAKRSALLRSQISRRDGWRLFTKSAVSGASVQIQGVSVANGARKSG